MSASLSPGGAGPPPLPVYGWTRRANGQREFWWWCSRHARWHCKFMPDHDDGVRCTLLCNQHETEYMKMTSLGDADEEMLRRIKGKEPPDSADEPLIEKIHEKVRAAAREALVEHWLRTLGERWNCRNPAPVAADYLREHAENVLRTAIAEPRLAWREFSGGGGIDAFAQYYEPIWLPDLRKRRSAFRDVRKALAHDHASGMISVAR
jgi:hypothetical protein